MKDLDFKIFVIQTKQLTNSLSKIVDYDSFKDTVFNYDDIPYTIDEIMSIEVSLSAEEYKQAIINKCKMLLADKEDGNFFYMWANYFTFDEYLHMNCFVDKPEIDDYMLSREEVINIAKMYQ
jgi:hypothetical protein